MNNEQWYRLFRALAFQLNPETAHDLTLRALRVTHQIGLLKPLVSAPINAPKTVMGLTFSNAVGLAAGMDKNGDCIDAFGALGFGFIEVGTVTPRPQPGNPRPRLFRLPQARALINRLGFNNKGIDYLVNRLQRTRYAGIIGVNIGKNFDTPLENAAQDYIHCLRQAYPYANYVVVNISSPNTPGLRQLQAIDQLPALLAALKKEQLALANQHGAYKPLLVKIAPDLDEASITAMGKLFGEMKIDGVIATNTTIQRVGVEGLPAAEQTGGLSGAPVRERATDVIRQLAYSLNASADAPDSGIPIIGVGGIMSAEDAREKFEAGASLVQIFSGLIYRGPTLITEIAALRNVD